MLLVSGKHRITASCGKKIGIRVFYLIVSTPTKDQIPSSRLNVDKVITYDRTIMVYKILREICPENFKGKFTNRTQISDTKLVGSTNILPLHEKAVTLS